MNNKRPSNQNIDCLHFDSCSGCSLSQNVTLPPIALEAQAFFKEQNIDCKHIHGNVTQWRIRAKLPVRGSCKQPLIGLYKAGTHDVVEIPQCKIHHPAINVAIEKLKEFIVDAKIEPYNENSKIGFLRYIQFVVQPESNKVQISFILNTAFLVDKAAIQFINELSSFWEQNKAQFCHSLWVNLNMTHTNIIHGPDWHFLFGDPWLWDTIGDAAICFHPACFGQANKELFERLIDSLKSKIFPNCRVTEFYAGIGVIGLNLASLCQEIKFCEIHPYSLMCFEETVKHISNEQRSKLHFHIGSAAERLDLLQNTDVVIVDPPRKGLDRPLLAELQINKSLKQIAYISCGWESFKRDCLDLISNGWKLQSAETFLFFPGSNYIETLAIFSN